MRKVISKNSGNNIPPKKYQKPSMQTVLPTLDKDFDKKLEALLKVPPLKLKDLKARLTKSAIAKKEREERRISN
jgi:hypothetical protein